MVARALWTSEALRVVPWLRRCTRLRLVQGLRPCVPLISTKHGQPFLIPLTMQGFSMMTSRQSGTPDGRTGAGNDNTPSAWKAKG